jgi:hypothetical protein
MRHPMPRDTRELKTSNRTTPSLRLDPLALNTFQSSTFLSEVRVEGHLEHHFYHMPEFVLERNFFAKVRTNPAVAIACCLFFSRSY